MHHWKQKVFCRNLSNFTSQLGYNKIRPANKILRFVFSNNKHITMEYLCSNIKVSFFTNCYSSYIWLLLSDTTPRSLLKVLLKNMTDCCYVSGVQKIFSERKNILVSWKINTCFLAFLLKCKSKIGSFK